MTFEDFQIKSAQFAPYKKPDIRVGQYLFNYLYQINPDLADLIRGTENDPFYLDNDDRISKFWKFVEENWHVSL